MKSYEESARAVLEKSRAMEQDAVGTVSENRKIVFPAARKLGVIAACACCALVIGFGAWRFIDKEEDLIKPQIAPDIDTAGLVTDGNGNCLDADGDVVTDCDIGGEALTSDLSETDDISETNMLAVFTELIHVNTIEEALRTDHALKYYSPEEYDKVRFDKEKIREFYGFEGLDGFDAFPDGLSEADVSFGGLAYIEKATGESAYDRLSILIESDDSEFFGGKTVRLGLSKSGLVTDCLYVFSEDMEVSLIRGIPCHIGYRQMEIYDGGSEPVGYYDLYVAYFSLNGIEYELVTEGIEFEEFALFLRELIGFENE